MRQLRIYEINPKLRAAFLDRFKNHATRIMQQYDIQIVQAWESETNGKLEFVYIIEVSGEKQLLEQLNKFLADEEWGNIKQQTRDTLGEMVLAKEERILTEVSR